MLTTIKSLFQKKDLKLSTDVYLDHLSKHTPTMADLAKLKQLWSCQLDSTEVKNRMAQLQPDVPWCHFFKLGEDHYTVRPEQAKHFSKAQSLKLIADQVLEAIPYITRKQDLKEMSILDLACAEGGHSIELANAGAKKVVGIEGRQLYVDRAQFIADCAGLKNVSFAQGDVRHISPETTGQFDLVLFFGILHHLSSEDYFPMLKSLYGVTTDTLVLHTHTSEEGWQQKFRLGDEITNADGLRGRLYREHPDGASEATKQKRIRNSLDNTFSFWAREASLLSAIKRAGFKYVAKQLAPNPFNNPTDEFRVFYICRK